MAALRDRFLNCGLASGNNDGTTEADAWRTFANCESGVEAGDIVHCKTVDGNRVTGEANMTFDSPAVAPTVDKPIKFQGYTTTPGDGGMFKWGHVFYNREKFTMIEGFDIEQSSSSASLKSDGDGFVAYRCHVVNDTASFDGACRVDDGSVVNCYVRGDLDGSGKVVRMVRGNLIDCYVEAPDDSSGGDCYVELNISFRMSSMIGTIINGTNRAVKGLTIAFDSNNYGLLVMNNTIYNTSDAIEFENGVGTNLTQIMITQDNIIWNATNGILNSRATNTSSVVGHLINNNAMGSISTAAYTNIQDEYIRNKITLTTEPFVDRVDFELNDAPGGGALCKFLGAGPRQYDPTLLGTTFANDRATGRRNFSSIGAVTPKGAETSHVF
jgi:hypothetical protein